MAESGLSIGFPDLQVEVGVYLGIGPTAASWSAENTALVDRVIQSGIRQFYYPPSDNPRNVHEWSFLRPTTTLSTVVDQWEYDLPDDFSRIVGNLYYDDAISLTSVPIIAYGTLLELRAQTDSSSVSRVAAVRAKATDATTGQRSELLLHSPPDAVYVLTYQYEAFNGKLTAVAPYPLGGMKYAETIISSCLAVAEYRVNSERGIHWEKFLANLSTAVAGDRNSGAVNFGYMGDPHNSTVSTRHNCRSSYPITYKGDTW